MRGRPLRFLALILTGWLAVRVTVLTPSAGPQTPRPTDNFETYAEARLLGGIGPSQMSDSFLPYAIARLMPALPAVGQAATVRPGVAAHRARRAQPALMSDARILALFGLRHYVELPAGEQTATLPAGFAPPGLAADEVGPIPGAAPAVLPSVIPSRWRLSGWMIMRPSGGDPRLVPLLSGSQAGARLSYALDARHRAAVFARIATPLSNGAGDQAVGVEIRSEAAPVTAFVELRRRDGLGLAPAAGVYGGMTATAAGFRLEGYGQAGMVGGHADTLFAEAQGRVARRIGSADGMDLDAGAGLWGAAQRGAARLDVGPTLGVSLPLGKSRGRLTIDWRQRIAGAARPNSGPAISLGADF